MTIAHITIACCWALVLASKTSETLIADALRLVRLAVQEACSLSTANASIGLETRALDITIVAKEALLTLALSNTLLSHTGSLLVASTDPSEDVALTLHAAVLTHESFLADTFCLLLSIRGAESIARAHPALLILRARDGTTLPEEPLIALAESDLLLFVVHAFPMLGTH